MRHLVTLQDLTRHDIETIFAISEDLKTKFRQGVREPLLPGRVMALVFEKQSLRTRVSFEAGMVHLGGGSMRLGDDVGFGKREGVEEFSRILSAMVDVIVVRSNQHDTVERVADNSSCSVINGLTDLAHPCQALADLYTIREARGTLEGAKLAWVGDGNNVSRSLAIGCAKSGVAFSIATPPGYELDPELLDTLRKENPESEIVATNDPAEAVKGASAVYTDVWASMGQEAEQEQRKRDFADFQVNAKLMAEAPDDALFMHCLPARRGEEVTGEVIDGKQSVIVPQAGNRMHVQKGILVWLLGAHSDT